MNKLSLSIALTRDIRRHFWHKRIGGKHLLPLLDPLSLVAKERLWRETFLVKFVFVISFSASWIKQKETGLRQNTYGFQNENRKNVVVS